MLRLAKSPRHQRAHPGQRELRQRNLSGVAGQEYKRETDQPVAGGKGHGVLGGLTSESDHDKAGEQSQHERGNPKPWHAHAWKTLEEVPAQRQRLSADDDPHGDHQEAGRRRPPGGRDVVGQLRLDHPDHQSS